MTVFQRESELVFVEGRPIALIEWINLGGVRTPLYVCKLEPSKLRQTDKKNYYYDGVTVDPRFEELPGIKPPEVRGLQGHTRESASE